MKPIISKGLYTAKNDVFYVFLNAFPYFKRKTMIRICFRISRTFAKDLSSGFSIKGLEKVFLVFKVASQMTFLNFELKSDIQNLKRRRPNCGINGGLTFYQIKIV